LLFALQGFQAAAGEILGMALPRVSIPNRFLLAGVFVTRRDEASRSGTPSWLFDG
jgi:hypothetical protein